MKYKEQRESFSASCSTKMDNLNKKEYIEFLQII